VLKVRVLVASRGQFSDIAVVYQAAEDKPNTTSAEWGAGYLGSMSVCGVGQRVKLSDSWPKFKFTEFYTMFLYITRYKFIFCK